MLQQLTKPLINCVGSALLFTHLTVFSENNVPQDNNPPIPSATNDIPLPSTDSVWLEGIHSTVSGSVFYSARWFDEFFSDDDSEALEPKTNLRVRLGWRPNSKDWRPLEHKFRLRLALPYLKNKVDFVFSDDDVDNNQESALEDVANKEDEEHDNFSAAARYVHTNKLDSLLDTRLGVSGGDVFLRTRYKKRFSLRDKHDIKLEPSISYYLKDGLGSKTLLEYNYNFSAVSQFRVSSTVKTSEAYKGAKWQQTFHRLTHLSDSSASAFGIAIQGIHEGKEGSIVHVYSLSYKYRFNAIRKWLFFEIEPFNEWREEHNYQATQGIALRIEGHFVRE